MKYLSYNTNKNIRIRPNARVTNVYGCKLYIRHTTVCLLHKTLYNTVFFRWVMDDFKWVKQTRVGTVNYNKITLGHFYNTYYKDDIAKKNSTDTLQILMIIDNVPQSEAIVDLVDLMMGIDMYWYFLTHFYWLYGVVDYWKFAARWSNCEFIP